METNTSQNHTVPRWLVASLGVLLIIFVAILIVQKGNDLITTIQNKKPANTIAVSGTGKVDGSPDLAIVSVGVLSQGVNAQTVTNANNTKVNAVIDFIKQQGIDAKDITTSQINLNPQQNYNSGSPVITGYQGNQTITVKVHGVDKSTDTLNKILDGAVSSGANEVNGPSFSFEKPDDLQQKARTLAIQDAKQKAQELANQAGLKLGKIVSISENGGGYPGPVPYMMNGSATMDSAMGKSVAPTIQTGSQDVSETMTLTFELK